MVKRNYVYRGPVFIGDVIFKSVEIEVVATSPQQALHFMSANLKKEFKQEVWLKEYYLKAVTL